jgi:hypothetical protein
MQVCMRACERVDLLVRSRFRTQHCRVPFRRADRRTAVFPSSLSRGLSEPLELALLEQPALGPQALL